MKVCKICGAAADGTYCERHEIEVKRRDYPRRHRKQRMQGKDRAAVRRAMGEAKARDGACRICGATVDLTAHYLWGGVHSADSADYMTLCRSCHGRLEQPRSTAARAKGGQPKVQPKVLSRPANTLPGGIAK